MSTPGTPPPIPRAGYPVEMHRPELVALVREVMSHVKMATEAPYMTLRMGRGDRAVSLHFTLDNGVADLGTYLVPLPEHVAALVDDEKRNPYRSLMVQVRTVPDQPVTAVATPEGTGS